MTDYSNKWSLASVYWEYEDELPEGLSDVEFSHMFEYSEIRDGVRMYPFIKIYDNLTGVLTKIYLGA